MKLYDYLGMNISHLLRAKPFNQWLYTRSVDEEYEEPVIHYVFNDQAMEVRCDGDDRISVIFMSADEHGSRDGFLFEIPFSWTRVQVRDYFGSPEKCGPRVSYPVGGEYGEWDRFLHRNCAVHVEYQLNRDAIKRITLIRLDAIP